VEYKSKNIGTVKFKLPVNANFKYKTHFEVLVKIIKKRTVTSRIDTFKNKPREIK